MPFYDRIDGTRAVERQAWQWRDPGIRMQPIDHCPGSCDAVDVVT